MNIGRRLNDDQLLVAELLIADPLAVEGLKEFRPSETAEYEIIGEYHISSSLEALWCCHCQAHRHWNGFVIETGTLDRHLIGSHCGQNYYGLSFSTAKRGHSELRARQAILQRLAGIRATSVELIDATREVMKSSGLRLLDQKQDQLRKASGDLMFRLAAAVRSGGFTEVLQIRDHAAEQRNPDAGPIYTSEIRTTGQVDGWIIALEDEVREAMLRLQGALAHLSREIASGTDQISRQKLVNSVRDVEERWDKAYAYWQAAADAPRFFTAANLDRLARWADQFSSFKIGLVDGALFVDTKEIEPLPTRIDFGQFPVRPA